MNFGVREHLTTILRHWGKIALVMFVAVMVTGAVAFLSSKVYVSQARILILNTSPAERAARPSSSDLRAGFASPQDQVLTQVAILKSPALAEKLAIELGPERVMNEMRWRWDWLREVPSKIKDNVILRIYDVPVGAQVLEQIGLKRPEIGGDSGPPIGAARDKLMKGLRAEAIVKTDMFGVSFAAPSGEFAAEALNGMIEVYVEHMVELRRPFDTATIAEKEADRLERVLGEAEEELRAFSKEFDILSIERQKDLLLDRWSRMQDELTRAEGSLRESESKLAVLEQEIATSPRRESISVTTRPNPVVDRLRERLVQLRAELQRYVQGSAAALRLRREIDTITEQLEREAQAVSGQQTVGSSSLYQELTNRLTLEIAEREAFEVRIQFLNRELEAVDTELRRVVSHELEYRQLARTVAAREEAYRFALLKREETAIQTLIAQSNLAQVVPVESGDVPARSSSPQRMRLLAMGIVAGLMAGIGMAYVLEFSRRTISTAEEAELALGLPVLAVTERFGFLVKRLKRTRLELRRFAVWVLRQAGPDRGVRVLFAAPHRQSGQSMLIGELASSLQKQGADVLTLRLELSEMRAPSVTYKPGDAKVQGARNEVVTIRAPAWEIARGVQEVLSELGQNGAIAAAIAETERAEVADAADADAPHDPSEPSEAKRSDAAPVPADVSKSLLASPPAKHPGLRDVSAQAVILIDAPNAARFPEIGALAEVSDRVIPVVEADRTSVPELIEMLESLQRVGVDLAGTVLTKRRMTRTSWAFGWMASTQRKMRAQRV